MVELVSKNYARALFDLAVEEERVDETGDEIKAIVSILKSEKNFYEFFITPLVSKQEKIDLVEKAFGGRVSGISENFLKVLIENGRTGVVEAVSSFYQKLRLEHFNMVEATAFTVIPMTDIQKQKLVEKLENETGKKVIFKNEINQDLLGGMLIKIGEKEIDGTVLNRLRNLEAAISK